MFINIINKYFKIIFKIIHNSINFADGRIWWRRCHPTESSTPIYGRGEAAERTSNGGCDRSVRREAKEFKKE